MFDNKYKENAYQYWKRLMTQDIENSTTTSGLAANNFIYDAAMVLKEDGFDLALDFETRYEVEQNLL